MFYIEISNRAKSRSLLIEWQHPSIIRDELKQEENDESGADDEIESNELIYSVQWRAKGSSESSANREKSLPMPSSSPSRQREALTVNRTLLIDELQPETVYSIQVYAQLGHTKSPYAFLEVKTLHERPLPGRPVDFRAEFVDDMTAATRASSADELGVDADDDEATNSHSNRVLRVLKIIILATS